MLDRGVARARVEGLSRVLTIPTVVTRIIALVGSGSASAAEIADEINQDQVLAAKLMKLVNSGFYGFRQPITTVSHATVLLGRDVVKTLVMTASVLDVIDAMTQLMEGLWEHSVGTARAAGALAEHLKMKAPEEIALSGLLHDLGKVVIAQAFPAEHAGIRQMVAERGGLVIDAEQEVLGVTHPEVAMWLLKKWSLDPAIVHPIAYHNNFHPRRDFADRTAVVHLADILCRAKGIGYPGDGGIPRINPEAWRLLGLDMHEVGELLAQLEVEAAAIYA